MLAQTTVVFDVNPEAGGDALRKFLISQPEMQNINHDSSEN